MIKQHNWKEASGVLSVLLQGTARERFPEENRHKYLATMELLKKMEGDHVRVMGMKRVYDIWDNKDGPMKKCDVKDRFAPDLECVLFLLTHRSLDEAHLKIVSLMEETKYETDPMFNMMAGLIYYEKWYSDIPEDMKLKSSDILEEPMPQELSGLGSYNPVESTCCNSAKDQDVKSPSRSDSTSSIGNNKEHDEAFGDVKKEPPSPVFQPQGFYINESSEMSGKEEVNNGINVTGTSIFTFRGLDVNLFPLRLPEQNENFGNSIYKYLGRLNDYHSKAVKHLRVALYSNPPMLASLLPLIQLLLLGDRVDEALKELSDICQTSNAILPLRITAVLLECLDSRNSTLLSSCYEKILNKDPTCSQSVTRLVTMHNNGDYGLVPLLEMIALHLEATYPASTIWRQLALCFLKISQSGEDQVSACGREDEAIGTMAIVPINAFPIRFIHGKSRESWELRCKWWSTRHFSRNTHALEIKSGDWELLTSKAACAAHLYGPEFWYVAGVRDLMEKEAKKQELLFLQLNMRSSVHVSERLKYEEIVLDDYSCCSS